jgi:serine/threonine protein kinase
MEKTSPKFLSNGTTLQSGKYRIQGVLGHGGFGITYLAENKLGKVAIKELFLNSGEIHCSRENTTQRDVIPHFEGKKFEEFRQRFESEANTLYSLTEITGVVRVLDIFEENSTSYFAMEFLDGDKLDDYIKLRGKLPNAEALVMVNSLGQTIAAIHKRNILHRDIKPTNIIVTKTGRVVLIDFGIARANFDDENDHTTFHTRIYSPPEQRISKSPMGKYSDVFALGATAYFIFTGLPPQTIEERITGNYEDAKQFVEDMPDHINAAITKSLAIKKEDRFQTVEEFLDALNQTTPSQAPVQPPQPAASGSSEMTQIMPVATAPAVTTPPKSSEETVLLPKAIVPPIAKPMVSDEATQIESMPTKSIPQKKAQPPIEDSATLIEMPSHKPTPNKPFVSDEVTMIDNQPKHIAKTLPKVNIPKINITKKQGMIGGGAILAFSLLIFLVTGKRTEKLAAPTATNSDSLSRRTALANTNIIGKWKFNKDTLVFNADEAKTFKLGTKSGKWYIRDLKGDTARLVLTIADQTFYLDARPIDPRESMTLFGNGYNIKDLFPTDSVLFMPIIEKQLGAVTPSTTSKTAIAAVATTSSKTSKTSNPTRPESYPSSETYNSYPVAQSTTTQAPTNSATSSVQAVPTITVEQSWNESKLLTELTDGAWKMGKESFRLSPDYNFKSNDGKGNWTLSSFKPALEGMTLILNQPGKESVFVLHKDKNFYLELKRVDGKMHTGKFFHK